MRSLIIEPLPGPVQAEVTVPGSKSYTIRALLLAAMTPEPVTILNPLFSDDTMAMMNCLNTLGIRTEWEIDGIRVSGSVTDVKEGIYGLDADLSAASIRFLIALSAVLPGVQTLYGKGGLNKRPVRELVEALRRAGAEIEYLDREGYPPVRVSSSRLTENTVRISGGISSQYISALLLISPLTEGLRIEVTEALISKPYIDMTIAAMKAFGVDVSNENYQHLQIQAHQIYRNDRYVIEADASSAAYFMAIAALTRSTVTLKHFSPDSLQADMRFIEILERMGNRVIRSRDQLTLEGTSIIPMDVDMEDCPDQAQTLAVLAAFADGATCITGIGSLRIKETDRIAAVQCELEKMGIRTESTESTLTIYGGNPKAAAIDTYGDHRMAMAFSVAASTLPGMEIREPDVVRKTFPGFWHALQRMGMPIRREAPDKIILIGFMGAGKSAVAPLIAEKLYLEQVDMDALILKHSGESSIREIFERDGEIRFRELEIATAKVLRHQGNMVISTGGGLVMNQLALDYLKESGIVVFLDAQLKTVLNRLKKDTSRPLLKNLEKARKLYELRMPLYQHYADHVIATDHKSPEQIADEIVETLKASRLVLEGRAAS